MPKESINKKIERGRRSRVHISYDVETGGATKKKEIPFVVGVLADLSGQPEKSLPEMKDRKFVQIDRDNFDTVLGKMQPRLVFKVDNKLQNDDTQVPVTLQFSSMEDFEPQRVVEQVEPLRLLMEQRRRLSNLRSSIYGKDKVGKMLKEILNDDELLRKLRPEVASPEPDSGSEKGN
jgi:type VI secretion system protein ImpB